MSQETVMRDLFDRWEQVWHEGRFDLVPSCVAETYIRHDPKGDRTVTQDAYATEIANIRKERPDIRVVVYDHSFIGNRAWFRFEFKPVSWRKRAWARFASPPRTGPQTTRPARWPTTWRTASPTCAASRPGVEPLPPAHAAPTSAGLRGGRSGPVGAVPAGGGHGAPRRPGRSPTGVRRAFTPA